MASKYTSAVSKPIASGLLLLLASHTKINIRLDLHLDWVLLRQIFSLVATSNEHIASPPNQCIGECKRGARDGQRGEQRLTIVAPGIDQYRDASNTQHTQRVYLCRAQVLHLANRLHASSDFPALLQLSTEQLSRPVCHNAVGQLALLVKLSGG